MALLISTAPLYLLYVIFPYARIDWSILDKKGGAESIVLLIGRINTEEVANVSNYAPIYTNFVRVLA